MAGRLDGKVAVVTGGASGIGEGTVRRFVAEGARVVIADLQAEPGEALAAELGSPARFIRTDVTSESDVAAAVDLAVSAFGRLDVMFNNAGIVGVIGRIADTPTGAWNRTVDVLLHGVFYGMKHAARVMVPQGSGSIISTSSTAGIMGGLGPHCYTACKHAVIGLTKSVASELASNGIRVNAISPGNTVTAMTSSVLTGDHLATEEAAASIASRSHLGIAGFPDDIAFAALYLASDEARYVTGHTLVVDAGQTTNGGSARFHQQPPALLAEAGHRDEGIQGGNPASGADRPA
jgi:NAD(P)-dependent dehydrogenase (short-subunit alcohol dehydrogenase family)